MACHFSEAYESAAELSAKEGLSDVEAERRVFQASHAELGAYVMTLWNIPDPIAEAIAYHHAPDSAVNPNNPVLRAVYAAENHYQEVACHPSVAG